MRLPFRHVGARDIDGSYSDADWHKGLSSKSQQDVVLGTGAAETRFDCMQLSRTCSHGDMSELMQSEAAGIRERFVRYEASSVWEEREGGGRRMVKAQQRH